MARVVYPPSGVTTARRLSDALTRYKYWHASRGGMASSPDHGKTCGRRGRFRPISLGNIADRNFPISDGDKAHIREGIQPPAPPRPEPIPACRALVPIAEPMAAIGALTHQAAVPTHKRSRTVGTGFGTHVARKWRSKNAPLRPRVKVRAEAFVREQLANEPGHSEPPSTPRSPSAR